MGDASSSSSSSSSSHKEIKYLGVHIRRKGEAVKMAAGSTRDDGTKAKETVMLGVVDKDIYFEPDQARRLAHPSRQHLAHLPSPTGALTRYEPP